jgi:hypothetical protein
MIAGKRVFCCATPAMAAALGVCGGALAVRLACAAAPERPNVILIFTDDHGYADLGRHGACTDVRTPNLDRLARDGVFFPRGYVTAPQCVPSCAGLLTGRRQNRFNLETNHDGPLPHPSAYTSTATGPPRIPPRPARFRRTMRARPAPTRARTRRRASHPQRIPCRPTALSVPCQAHGPLIPGSEE